MLESKDGILWLRDIAFVPSIHGRVAFARETRRVFLGGRFPTVAVELPESLGPRTIEGIERLPKITTVSYEESNGTRCFFPIDPCDSIIEALRLGLGESCALELIDCDVEDFQRTELVLPDSYAVNSLGLARFYEAVRPTLQLPAPGSQDDQRERHMAGRLLDILNGGPRGLPALCVIGLGHMEGVARHLEAALSEGRSVLGEISTVPPPFDVEIHEVSDEESLYHILGELPYTTYLYELQRSSITLDPFEAVDKIKELLLEARDRYHTKHSQEYEKISLGSFQNLLQLVRNHCLLGKRLTPSLYEMVIAAKGIAGSEFAIDVIETAKRYPPAHPSEEPNTAHEPGEAYTDTSGESGSLGEEALFEDSVDPPETGSNSGVEAIQVKKRYVDEANIWKRVRLEPPPPPRDVKRWRSTWNPNGNCSWTPEDVLIENFAGHIRSRALLESGVTQEHLEEFKTSLKDGIHVRETIRNLHLGKIIVKETPPPRGQVGAVVIIYEPPDPTRFPWHITWLPEFEWESVLAFYATAYSDKLIGPGIARSLYGGQLFVRPDHLIEDVWSDTTLNEARDDAERLVLAGVLHSSDAYVAYVAATAPTPRMKEYAHRWGKKIIYLPLSGFSRSTLQKLRRFHVLNGKPVRGWANLYIR